MKRIFDIGVIVALSPVWLGLIAITAITSLIVSGRKIFFIQERSGINGKPFKLVKFRTMRDGDGSDAERMTKFGSFLRNSSIDELPELFNVIKGDMSLVGPRPLPIRYLPRYTAEQRRRLEVLPGITGWAQVNGRNQISWDEKFKLDIEYVERRSLWFDLKIIYLTIWQVISRRGISHDGEATMPEFTG